MRIAITGATGLLGRNLLFEIIKQNINNLDSVEIIVLGRNKDGTHIGDRIKEIVLTDGIAYMSASKNCIESIKRYCKSGIKSIYIDLDKAKLDMEREDFNLLKSKPIDSFFHIAALTDFRDTPEVVSALKRTNIYGTQQILELAETLKVGEFCYVGSAYSCGTMSGNIKPDYVNGNQMFRNPYEVSKLEAENIVRKFSKKTKTKCRFFRPSTICGRLIETHVGTINKFDVFYAWAAFFLRMKSKKLKTWEDRYKNSVNMDIRIHYSLKSGLNIVPADYAAKVIYHLCAQKDPGESYHLVNNQETPHDLYIKLTLKTLNILGTKHVDQSPKNMNTLEKLYYRTVGKVFTPYITSEPMLFDISSLTNVLHKANLSCPPVDESNFLVLMDYAKKHDFGSNEKGSLSTRNQFNEAKN